jgi:ubiquinone/menaquinone biosynthesis C-methylase UbiE
MDHDADWIKAMEEFRMGEKEQLRAKDLMRIVPKGLCSVLDIGAKDGYYSRLLTDYFEDVTALDLELPTFHIKNVTNVKGDATHLDFPDNSFDCVFCTEVLEHVPEVEKAAREISRVAKSHVVVGVPYRQDIRIGRSTCINCGKINPPWGHVNIFDEKRLRSLFGELTPVVASFIGTNKERTNPISTWLMDLGGNPWGASGPRGPYDQDEPCIHCGVKLSTASGRSFVQKALCALAGGLNQLQNIFVKSKPNVMHMVFRKAA